MTPFSLIEKKLNEGMYEHNMHGCLRDIGNLAGGFLASGSLNYSDVHSLKEIACNLAKDPEEASKKWDEGIEFGQKKPVQWESFRDHYNQGTGGAIPWNGTIGKNVEEDPPLINPNYLEDIDVIPPDPDKYDPLADFTKYIKAIYNENDIVGYCTECRFIESANRHVPTKGTFHLSAGELIASANKYDEMGWVVGDWNPKVGAWIRLNPLDGKGVKDENVVDLRYALVESDEIPIERQRGLLRKLRVPVKVLVHSGGKSLHAVIPIHAKDMKEYREKVDALYDICQKEGLAMDRQNRNPSRLSRMPGITRNGNLQYIVAMDEGMEDFDEWRNWYEDTKDGLPDFETLKDSRDPPELDEEMIKEILRKGHKLLLSGPSKAGKSFCLQQLAIAVATGGYWLGWKVKRGRVCYINLELAKKSNEFRFWKIRQNLDWPDTGGNLDVWNLRGNAVSMDKLAPKIIRRSEQKRYTMIIIDPIYKVLTGDENSAQEMAHFCNQFDKIAVNLETSVIYGHHHSKGAQGQKTSRDRSSGSGVFARDPDAIIDMIELIISDKKRKEISTRWQREAYHELLDGHFEEWRLLVPAEQQNCLEALQKVCREHCPDLDLTPVAAEELAAELTTAWRVEGTLREFAPFAPRDIFFKYPLHIMDYEKDPLLSDCVPESDTGRPVRNSQPDEGSNYNEKKRVEADLAFKEAFKKAAGNDTKAHWKEVARQYKKPIEREALKNRAERLCKEFDYERGIISLRLETTEVKND